MERFYTVRLNLDNAIPHDLFKSMEFRNYLHSLGVFKPEETFMKGTFLCTNTKDGNSARFEWNYFHIQPKKPLEESEAVRYALALAKQLESAKPQFNPRLTFNPNLIYLFVDADSKGKRISYEGFIANAIELQKIMYGGGNIAYYVSSGDFGFFLGLKSMFNIYKPTGIVKVEGAAKPAASLDELLARLGKNQPSQ